MSKLTIRIDVAPGAAFGPGKARLLELIDQTGSIRRAAVQMEMSYRRAWLLLQEIDVMIGSPAVETRTGGAQGGGATLTTVGRAVVQHYRAIEARATECVSAELRSLAKLAAGARHSPARKR